MKTLSVRIPDSLHREIKNIAEDEEVSMNLLINSAISEKISALKTEEHLKERAERASEEAFIEAMKKVPDQEPSSQDRRTEKNG